MPIAGFKRGDEVLTPAGRRARVTSISRGYGREYVYVRLLDEVADERRFMASSLRLIKSNSER